MTIYRASIPGPVPGAVCLPGEQYSTGHHIPDLSSGPERYDLGGLQGEPTGCGCISRWCTDGPYEHDWKYSWPHQSLDHKTHGKDCEFYNFQLDIVYKTEHYSIIARTYKTV